MNKQRIPRRKGKLMWIIVALLCLFALVTPAFLPNECVCFNPITHTFFHIPSEDENISIILDGGTESWRVELTGDERKEAIEAINDMKYYFWLPSHQLFFPTGGWDQCFRIVTPDRHDAYIISDNCIEVGFLTVYCSTKEIMELIDYYRPEEYK